MANAFEPDGREELPMFQSGRFVKETGLADVPQIEMPDERNVNYVFPVEIVVVGALTEDDHREIHQRIWNDWGDAMGYQSA
jgi:hypothetical protein